MKNLILLVCLLGFLGCNAQKVSQTKEPIEPYSFTNCFPGVFDQQAHVKEPKKTKGVKVIKNKQTHLKVYSDTAQNKYTISLWKEPLAYKINMYDSLQNLVAYVDESGKLTVLDSLKTIQVLLKGVMGKNKFYQ